MIDLHEEKNSIALGWVRLTSGQMAAFTPHERPDVLQYRLPGDDLDDDVDGCDLDDLVAIDEANRTGESMDFDEFCRNELDAE